MTIINHNQFRRFSFQCIEVVSYSPVKQNNIVTLVKTGQIWSKQVTSIFVRICSFWLLLGPTKSAPKTLETSSPFTHISETSITIYKMLCWNSSQLWIYYLWWSFNLLSTNLTKWSNTLNLSAVSLQIVWVCWTILWGWRLKG